MSNMSPARAATGFSSIFRRIAFQKLLILAVIRLTVYVFKLVEDTKSVKNYRETSHYDFMLVSAACLIIPPLFYSIYLMGQNLTKDDVIDNRELGTKAVNGLLLMPWQIKRHLDVLHYAAQRVCQFRPPDKQESQDLQTMERNAEVLEFFEDLYAGFMQILVQTFVIFHKEFGPDASETIPQNVFVAQLVVSCLSVSSMLIAVRRRDDGPLTGFLSLFGWTSLFVSRVLVISLAATVIGWLTVVLALIHVLAISIWVYNIAVQSHLAGMATRPDGMTQWADTRRRVSTAIMTFLFFGIPSLVIWPIMFQLKEGRRPLCYLIIVTIENLILLGIWLVWKKGAGEVESPAMILIAVIVITTLAGVFFLLIYVFCKPKYTDQVVLFEIRESRAQEAPTLIKRDGPNSRSSNATQYGIYYEFCDLVFKLPSTHKIASDLEEIRTLTRATHSSPVHAT